MKKLSFKKLLLAVLSLVMVLTLASCGIKEYQNALAGYLLPEDGTTVEGDFILDSSLTVGEVKYDLTWKSSNEAALAIQENKDENGNIQSYTAKVDLQNEITDVTLTLGIGKDGRMSKVSKEFHVNVAALTVYSFSSAYSFPKDKATVTEDFDLSQSFTLRGKTATIAWSVDERYQSYIRISEDGTKCLVTGNDLMPQVLITATFTYNGESTNKSYRMVASRAKTQPENVDDWYYNVGSSIDFNGYVVEIATVYSEQYGNVSFYAVDENNNAGYYVYRGSISKDDAANLEKGAYVSVTACTSTNYNGLIESTAGCKVTVDASKKDVAKAEAAYALDEDLFAEAPQALYAQSRLVSLSAWKVKKVEATALGSSSPTKLLTLEKEGKTITVNVTKYFEGAYAFKADDEQIAAIMAKLATIQANDYVNVTGVLGNYNGEQIALLSAAGLEKVEAEAEGTAHPGLTVKPLIAANLEALEDAKIQKGSKALVVAATKTVTLAASTDDVTITYELMGPSNNVALNANVLTITPADEEKVTVKVTYTCGEYVSIDFFAVRSVAKTDQEKVDEEIEAFDDDNWSAEVQANTTITSLPENGATYDDVRFSYAVENEDEAKLVEITEGRLIYLLPVDENKNVTVKVTATLNEASATTTFTITITPESFNKYTVVTAPEADKEYYLGLYQATVGKWMFINGELSGNYGASVEDYTQAKKVKLVITDEATMSAKIQVLMGNDVVKYLNIAITSDNKNNLAFGDDAETATVWKWNAEHSTGTTMGANNKEVYLGGYGTYTTFSFSVAADYLPKCDIEGATSFCIKFYVVEADNSSREERAQKSLDALRLEAKLEEDYTLPTEAAYGDVKLSYALKEAVAGQSIENGVLKITRGDADVELTIVATATCGLDVVKTKEFTVTVVANATKVSFEEAYAIVSAYEGSHTSELKYELVAYVGRLDSYNNAWLTDGSGREIEAYKLTTCKVGDIVKITGNLCKYVSKSGSVTLEMTNCRLEETLAEGVVKTTPTELYNMFKDGNATDEQKNTIWLVCAPVTKIQNTPGGNYITGNYWVADATGTIEAYKLGQLNGLTDVLLGIEVGSTISFYGKATLYNTTVETSPSTLLNLSAPIATEKVENLASGDEYKVVRGVVERLGESNYYAFSDGTGIIGLLSETALIEGNTYVLKLGKLAKQQMSETLVLDLLCSDCEVLENTLGTGSIAAAQKSVDEVNAVGKFSLANVSVTSNVVLGESVSLLLLGTNFQLTTLEDGSYNLIGFAVKVDETSEPEAQNKTYQVVFVVTSSEKQTLPAGTEYSFYKADTNLEANKGDGNSYSGTATATIDGVEWKIEGNSTMNPWRLGGKSITDTNRAVYTQTALANKVSKIVISVGTASGIVVNSMKVDVYSTAALAAAGGDGDVASLSPTFAASSDITVTNESGADWSNCFYRVTFNVTVSGTSNKFVQFSAIEFFTKVE